MTTPSPVEHFGETLRVSRFGFRMSRAMYGFPNRSPHQRFPRELLGEELWKSSAWAYRDAMHGEHSDLYLLAQRDDALRNYDLSMRYFQSLDSAGFEDALDQVLGKAKSLKPVERLADFAGADGAYVMVFDDYKQMYIGQSSDIRKRIRSHWSGRKSFDRLVYGDVYRSILPVDEFRALDNTRIYAARSRNRFSLEERAERVAQPQYCLNRIGGGELSPFMQMLAVGNPRGRDHETAHEASREQREHAVAEVGSIIGQRHREGKAIVEALTQLDMRVFQTRRDDGSPRLWSRRDLINSAARRGELSVPDFAAFLTAMGETIVWPDR